jgi:hypothetical protein
MSEDTTKKNKEMPKPHSHIPNSTMDELYKDGGEL